MEIHTSNTPAQQAGLHIASLIEQHDGDVACLLSGGSALDIVPYINIKSQRECRTIFMMGDERVSGEPTINNYLQLKTRYEGHPVTKLTIPTVPLADESDELFATRIEKTFLQTLRELNNVKIISILGIGVDGHTAGIFPMEKSSFQSVYRDDRTYVPVHLSGLKIDSRASFTPAWLLNNVSVIIGYVTGEAKRGILAALVSESKEIFERPAEVIKRHKNAHLYTDI